MPKILGIDYSLNGTGLSIFDGKVVLFRKVFTTLKKYANNDDYILSPKFETMQDKIDWVCETIIGSTKYDFVTLENHLGRYYDWTDGYAIIKYLLRQNKVPYISVNPKSVKRYAGDGAADKLKMTKMLKSQYKISFDDIDPHLSHNIVDATWLAIIGSHYYDLYINKNKINLNTTRLEILTRIHSKLSKEEK